MVFHHTKIWVTQICHSWNMTANRSLKFSASYIREPHYSLPILAFRQRDKTNWPSFFLPGRKISRVQRTCSLVKAKNAFCQSSDVMALKNARMGQVSLPCPIASTLWLYWAFVIFHKHLSARTQSLQFRVQMNGTAAVLRLGAHQSQDLKPQPRNPARRNDDGRQPRPTASRRCWRKQPNGRQRRKKSAEDDITPQSQLNLQ